MMIAQQLYEGLAVGSEGSVGLITYMRTDSVQVADVAVSEAREYITKQYGKDYLPDKARVYTTKAKAAQEAHEAVRPTSIRRDPESMKSYLTAEQYRLYVLIWSRMLASQMADARSDATTVDIDASGPNTSNTYVFRATGSASAPTVRPPSTGFKRETCSLACMFGKQRRSKTFPTFSATSNSARSTR